MCSSPALRRPLLYKSFQRFVSAAKYAEFCPPHPPAAVDASAFLPDLAGRRRPGGRITVVALSRLVYRKGVDLLNVVIPAICRRQPHVDFVIGTCPRLFVKE